MGLIRKFFWGSVVGGILLCVNFVMGGPNLAMSLVGMGDLQAQLKEMQKYTAAMKRQDFEKSLDLFQPSSKTEVSAVEPQVDTAPVQYEFDGKKYVFIRGRYYEAREDNIYEIDGERVYYVNNRRRERKDQMESAAPALEQKVQAPSAPVDPVQQVASAKGFEDVGRMPTNAAELAKNLKQLQESLKGRNVFLQELSESRPGR